jgi:hypothetical protein
MDLRAWIYADLGCLAVKSVACRVAAFHWRRDHSERTACAP